MSEKPRCFGHVLNSRDWLKTKGIELIKDCKECDLLTDCTAKYNEQAYNQWCEDEWDHEDDEWDDDPEEAES